MKRYWWVVGFLVLGWFFGADKIRAAVIVDLKATAVNASGTSDANLAVDGSLATSWNSGGFAPQSITLDLNHFFTVTGLDLVYTQSSSGRTVNSIWASTNGQTWTKMVTVDQITQNNQEVQVKLMEPQVNVRYIRITTETSPSWVAWKEIGVTAGTKSVNQNLKHFGYMSCEGLYNTPLPSLYKTEIDGLTTNIVWSFASQLDSFRELGIKPVLTDVRWLFFDGGNLRSDWQAQWQAFRNRLVGKEDWFYGFYIDEPFWNGYTEMAFTTATKAMRDAYPDKAVLAIEAVPPIRDQSIPANYYQYVTDLGFDYYYTLDFADNDTGWADYLSVYELFKPYLMGKKIWLIPDGFSNTGVEVLSRWPEAHERYFALAQTNEAISGIFSFIYDCDSFTYTLRNKLIAGNPEYDSAFRNRQLAMGRSVVMPKLTNNDLNADGQVNLIDFNRLIEGLGVGYDFREYELMVEEGFK